MGLQFMLEVGSFAALTLAVSTFSELDMAAHQIALQVIHFSFMPCVAVGEAASVLTGQAVGADRDDLVPGVARRAALLAASYAGACAIGFFVGSRTIAGAFTTDAAVIGLVVRLLKLAALFQLFDAINIIARSVLRGAGDVRYAAIVGVVVAWMCTPTLAWGLGHGLRMGALGGWLGVALEILVTAALLGTRVERRGWARAARVARARLRASVPAGRSEHQVSTEQPLLPEPG
jgi:MATE family multidrug resistance protein